MQGIKNQNAKQSAKQTSEQKNNTATNDDVKYSLKKYSQHQIDNWSNSKNIIVYENEQQLREFISDARSGKNLFQKIYFGIIPENLAIRIKQDTGIDVKSYNCTLRASEIRKIFNDHGNEQTENKRGQRAITEDDFVSIPQIIQSPDEIRLSNVLFEGKPVIQFIKTLNGKTTVVAYVSKKHLDLTVQTMYSGKNKRNLATAAGEQAPANTPEANVGTVPTNSISQTNEKSNTQFSARDTEYLKAVENGDLETAQRMVDEMAKKAGYSYKLYHQTERDFTIFETKHPGAGTRDYETPFGVFMKPTSRDIGLKGKKQMQLYAKISKPLIVKNRKALIVA